MITTVFLLRLILILCMIRNSLTPNLVLRALKDSISECREEWSDDFCEWLCDIVNLSMNASMEKWELIISLHFYW